jgi:hypothetical protein
MQARGLLLLCAAVFGCSLSGSAARVEQSQASLRALGTLHDFEIARRASATHLTELEGLHQLDPGNRELLTELTRAWVTETELFTSDDLEAATDQEDSRARLYHLERVQSGFARASFWGREWLHTIAADVDLDADRAELEQALKDEFDAREDAEPLLWLGHALLGAGEADARARRAAPVVLERSIALDQSVRFGSAHALLARKYALSTPPDFEKSRQHFDRAEALAGNEFLLTRFYHATAYYCRHGNQAELSLLLNQVLKTSDPEPTVRLENATAKRRAQRWTVSRTLARSCAFGPEDSAATGDSAPIERDRGAE